ncbi:MAG: preprotein translocase subunit SecA [Bacteroidota bacterium]
MFNFIKKLFGTSSERALKKLHPYLQKVNKAYEELQSHSDDRLRKETVQLKKQIETSLQSRKGSIEVLKQKAAKATDLREKIKIYAKADQEQAQYDKEEEKVLMDILPKAFAIMKETAHRFSTKPYLSVEATDYDREMAAKYSHVTIEGNKAFWHNQWEAGGEKITWNMVHYDVQILGGIVLHQGKVAEMRTGEGKTLAATLPIFLNALPGRGVHVFTVNDYLARRDAEWMGPLYQFHGLSVACVDSNQPFSERRKKAYQADISYSTGSAGGFDYLRDNMATSLDEKVQRGHNYAIVDEVDSVLIDEARTPLIISGEATYTVHQEYYALKPFIHQLYQVQYKHVAELMKEAKTKILHGGKKEREEGGLALFRVYRGLPKYKPLIHFLSEKGIKQLLSETEDYYLQENARLMPEADEVLLFTIDEKLNNINLTEKGVKYLAEKSKQPDFFILPDIATEIANIENAPNLKDEEKITQKEELIKEYGIKSARLHAVNQLLKAYALFEEKIDYLVINRKVKIVDEKTGRILEGRRYSDGLHQALEAKENVKIEAPTQTYATITPQNQFRMYRKLAGMTGTAETEATEFWEIYKLEVVVIPTHKPVIREDLDDVVFKTRHEKLAAIKTKVEELKKSNRPVLVNTTSVEASEEMRNLLGLKKNEVLNARNHAIESKIIAKAGEAGKVTVVTQMGGRGTDIKLTPEAKEAGGLFVLLSEKNPNERIDNQARGRSGRQGDPGRSQAFVCLEDPLIAHFKHGFMGKRMDSIFQEEGEAIQDPMITSALRTAQQRIEQQHFYSRKRSLEYDDVMNMQRVVIYSKRDHALLGNRLSLDLMSMCYNLITHIVEDARNRQSVQSLQLDLTSSLDLTFSITEKELVQQPADKIVDEIYQKARTQYEKRTTLFKEKLLEMIKSIPSQTKIDYFELPTMYGEEEISAIINLTNTVETKGEAAVKAIESAVTLHFLDECWKTHLYDMDQLREASRNAVYENKDPLLVYKFDSLELFKELMHKLNRVTMAYLTHWTPRYGELNTDPAKRQRGANLQGLATSKAIVEGEGEDNFMQNIVPTTPNKPIRTQKIASRNQRVTVKYKDGKIKKDVKYKTVANDLDHGLCELVEAPSS